MQITDEVTVTKPLATKLHKNLNKHLFNNRLRTPRFRLITDPKIWGCCNTVYANEEKTKFFVSHIELQKRFPTGRLLVDVLAHEMVHQFEDEIIANQLGCIMPDAHGPSFFEWSPKFAKIGLALKEKY